MPYLSLDAERRLNHHCPEKASEVSKKIGTIAEARCPAQAQPLRSQTGTMA
jgi:hypothetical protein